MEKNKQVYKWKRIDKIIHLLPALPLIMFYAGTIYLLSIKSIVLVVILIILWIATNLSITRICAGCPYRGKYCPGLCQLFIAPYLSLIIFKKGIKREKINSFTADLLLLGLFGIGSYIFAFYYLFILYWTNYYLVIIILLVLLLLNMGLSFFLLCPKCSYNTICPIARVYKTVNKK
jgi:hypothetical protein